jgi:cytochrome oxidase Cu insertion factor (SCO1/SenC/PrrC family)
MRAPGRVAFALLPVVSFGALAHERAVPVLDPPAGAFGPPRPGTYDLPPIPLAARGTVLDETGRAHDLAALLRGRITLLGLVYTHCTDPDGCPRATWAFSKVRELLSGDASLQRRAQLLTLSFDPAHDTPGAMAEYAAQVRGRPGGTQWRFLTTRSTDAVAPILQALDQDVTALPGSVEAFEHTVKVYLFDPHGRAREIYSSAYLVPEMIVNDMRTLALDRAQCAASASGGHVQKRLRSP